MSTTKINWNEQVTQQLVSLAGESPVSQATVAALAEQLGTTPRSIGAKLRKLGYEVDKAVAKSSAWSAEQESALSEFVRANANAMTYAEIAATFQNGEFSSKQVQGKLLNMELFHLVKRTEKQAAPRTYTPEEEVRFVEMVNAKAPIEEIAAEFARSVNSIRGKALSLFRSGHIAAMPIQSTSTAKEVADIFAGLDIANMSVADIAAKTGKTERGIKSTLSRRGLSATDYNGAAKREKLDTKNA